MMIKYKHLHDKIRSTRRSLGLKQKDFILKVSEQLGRGDAPLSQGLVSQWEARRTTPTEAQIAAIANLTAQPWWTMLWFMHDDLPADRGVDYHPDGSFVLAPELTDEEVYEMQRQMGDERNVAPDNAILAWQKDARKIHDLRQDLAVNHAYLATGAKLHGLTAEKDKLPSDSKISTPVNYEIKGVLGNAILEMDLNKAMQGGIMAIRPPCVEDLVDFRKNKPRRNPMPDETRLQEGWDEDDDLLRRLKQFDSTLAYHLEENYGFGDVQFGMHRIIDAGAIKAKAFFHSHGISVQKGMLHPTSSLHSIATRLKQHIGELLLVDRIQNRSAKKMVVFATYENNLDLSKLKERFSSHINSAALLGITLAFSSGPEQTASEMAALIASFDNPP